MQIISRRLPIFGENLQELEGTWDIAIYGIFHIGIPVFMQPSVDVKYIMSWASDNR